MCVGGGAEDFQSSNGWVAWGINPTSPQMAGTQALVAFRNTTGGVLVKTYDVTAAVKNLQRTLVPGPVTVDYSNYSASATAAGTVTISGTLKLTAGQSTALNLVWNRGPVVVAVTSALTSHSLDTNNLASYAVVEMSTGQQTAGGEVRNKDLKDVSLPPSSFLPCLLFSKVNVPTRIDHPMRVFNFHCCEIFNVLEHLSKDYGSY